MSFRFLIVVIFCALNTIGQNKKPDINDFSVSLHEETVNKVISAVGDISGTKDYQVLLINGKYHWTIKNAKINIRPDSSAFTCDAFVTVGPFNYKTKVPGNVKVTYDADKNLIYIQISRAIFELYTMIFGKKIHIKDIHLEEYFKEPFTFDGPRSMKTEMEFMMPDSTIKKIYVQPTTCKMELKWKEICTACEIAASDKPFNAEIKLIPPIEAKKSGTPDSSKGQKN
jgi:hypothetical protein